MFDLTLVIERDTDKLAGAAPFLVRHREKFLEQSSQPGPGLLAAFEEAIAVPGYQPSFEHCVGFASSFLTALPLDAKG